MVCYVGIDIGSRGAICVLSDEQQDPLLLRSFPTIAGRPDVAAFADLLLTYDEHQLTVVIEDLHSIFGVSAKSNFAFGWINGATEAVLQTLKLRYAKVQPKRWQKVMWEGVRPVMKPGKKRPTVDTKPTSLLAAQRLFPNVRLTVSDRAMKPHDGLVDALLLAAYAKRTNL